MEHTEAANPFARYQFRSEARRSELNPPASLGVSALARGKRSRSPESACSRKRAKREPSNVSTVTVAAEGNDYDLVPIFVAPPPARYREVYFTPGHCEQRLRLLFVGHNPSLDAWESGVPYGNPTNRFWNLLRDASITPPGWRKENVEQLPAAVGVGMIPLGCEPGNDANLYPRETMLEWRAGLYARLRSHLRRVWEAHESADYGAASAGDIVRRCAPRMLAFTGKRQWAQLFEPPLKKVEQFGLQPLTLRPPGWPLGDAPVFVLSSSSGRAVLTNEARLAPYVELGRHVAATPWPAE